MLTSIQATTTIRPWFGSARPAVVWLRTLTCCAASVAMSAVRAQAQGDTWIGPWDWKCQVDSGPPVDGSEFSHSALIPHGPYRGMVLIWRAPRNLPPDPPQTESWIFNPASPAALLKVEQELASDIFCSAMTWDKDGQLVVAGGAPGGASAPTEAYRFYPTLLQYPPKYALPFDPCNPATVEGAPWRSAGEMSIGRYYPTLITLFKGDILGTPVIGGASSFVLGGLAQFDGQIAFGNDYWQLLEHASITWSRTFHSPNETFDPPLGGSKEPYDLKNVAGLPVPNPDFENYPRIVQLTTVGQDPVFTKSLFVANDVWPDGGGAMTSPGDSWVIRPRYSGGPSVWELWTANNAGTAGPNPSIDRHYGSAVLLHTLQVNPDSDGKNRVLVFGGQQMDPSGPRINPTVQEFRPGVNPTDPTLANGGEWVTKSAGLTHPRTFANAIILPTGEILIVGGMKECPCDPDNRMPEHRPELYKPGDAGQISGASTTILSPSNPAAPGYEPYARGYHQVALLLPDGRVFSAGGAEFQTESVPIDWLCPTISPCQTSVPNYKSGMYSGEIYAPPYMGYSPRPSITSAPASIQFGAGTFSVSVDEVLGKPIDRFVLLRPGSVTHHFDSDQRYVELPFASTGSSAGIETFDVALPADDLGPPGHYMLFAVRDLGAQQRVPSAAWWIRIE